MRSWWSHSPSWLLGILLAGGLLSSCRRPVDLQPPPPEGLRGTVRVVGHLPFAYPVLETGEGGVRLEGALAEEVSTLSGAVIRAWGQMTRSPDQPVLTLEGYEVLEIARGVKPWVGVLEEEAQVIYLVSQGERQLLQGPLIEELQGHVGAKVWVAGVRSGAALIVEGFGIIKEVSR